MGKREKYFVPDWLGEMKDEKIPQLSSPLPQLLTEKHSEVCGEGEKGTAKNKCVDWLRCRHRRSTITIVIF